MTAPIVWGAPHSRIDDRELPSYDLLLAATRRDFPSLLWP
jgi:hypothetical protein